MNPDKYLTDLASFTSCDSVSIEWRGYFSDGQRFHARIAKLDKFAEYGWLHFNGEGPTVEAAVAEARAKMLDHYAEKSA